MKKYEIMTISDQDLGEDGARDISNKIKDLISANKGKVLDSDFWGKRALAYEINHKNEGFYEVINFEIDPDSMAKFKQKLNLINGLVRYLITVQGGKNGKP
jgi:small subunit ribosomal protein S6